MRTPLCLLFLLLDDKFSRYQIFPQRATACG